MHYWIKAVLLTGFSLFFISFSSVAAVDCKSHQAIVWDSITFKKLHAQRQYQLRHHEAKIALFTAQWDAEKRVWAPWTLVDSRRFGRGITTPKALAWAHKKASLEGYRPHFNRNETDFVSWHCSMPKVPMVLQSVAVTEVDFTTPEEVWSANKAWLPCVDHALGTSEWRLKSRFTSTSMSWQENCDDQEGEWLIHHSSGVGSQWYRFPALSHPFIERDVVDISREYDVVGMSRQGDVAAVSRSVFNLRGGDFAAVVFEVMIHRNQRLYRLPEHKILTSAFVLPQARLSGDGEVIWLVDQHRVLRYRFDAAKDRYVLDVLKLLPELEHLRYVQHTLTVSDDGQEAWLTKERSEMIEGDASITRHRFKLTVQ